MHFQSVYCTRYKTNYVKLNLRSTIFFFLTCVYSYRVYLCALSANRPMAVNLRNRPFGNFTVLKCPSARARRLKFVGCRVSSVHVKALVVRSIYDVVLLLVAGHVHAARDFRRVDEALVRQRFFVDFPGHRGQHQHFP